MSDKNKLNPRQVAFVREYLKDRNAGRAYKKVYRCRASVAATSGPRMLKNLQIKAEINKLIQQDTDRLDLSREKVLRAYSALAFGDIRDLFTWDDAGVHVKDSSSLTKEQAMMMQAISMDKDERETKDGEIVRNVRIKINPADRQAALMALGRHLGLFNDKLRLDGGKGSVMILQAGIPEPDPPPAE